MANGPAAGPPLLKSVFGQARSAGEDLLHLKNMDVLRGVVLNETLEIDTPYASIKVKLRKCAGVSFEDSDANTEAVVTVNRNRISGVIRDRIILFRVASSGEEVSIRKEKIRFIVLRRRANERGFLDDLKNRFLFVMSNGDLLTGKMGRIVITTVTKDGRFYNRVFCNIYRIERQGWDDATVTITSSSGRISHTRLKPEETTLALDIGVKIEGVHAHQYAKIFVAHVPEEIVARVGTLEPTKGESRGDEADDSKALGPPRELTLDLGQGVVLEMVLIQPGEFDMGSPESEVGRNTDEVLHKVRISKAFYMAKYETTQAVWKLVTENDPSRSQAAEKPVQGVSWYDCQSFIEQLGQLLPGRKFRLPTESEWEYACRAGTQTRFSFGDNDSDLVKDARGHPAGNHPQPAGTKPPNAWGLHDMHGGVLEWCQDPYNVYWLPIKVVLIDPIGWRGSNNDGVLRGGHDHSKPGSFRSACRLRSRFGTRRHHQGCRLVLELN